MQTENDSENSVKADKTLEQNNIKSPFQSSSNILSKPFIAGILLIIAGVIAILSWIPFITGDETLITFAIENFDMNMTREQIRQAFVLCGSIEIVLSIFVILGGILAFQRKIWMLTVVCSIIGLFTIGQFIAASGLSLIALILLLISKQEFQKKID